MSLQAGLLGLDVLERFVIELVLRPSRPYAVVHHARCTTPAAPRLPSSAVLAMTTPIYHGYAVHATALMPTRTRPACHIWDAQCPPIAPDLHATEGSVPKVLHTCSTKRWPPLPPSVLW